MRPPHFFILVHSCPTLEGVTKKGRSNDGEHPVMIDTAFDAIVCIAIGPDTFQIQNELYRMWEKCVRTYPEM
jgi:hypothetical protein